MKREPLLRIREQSEQSDQLQQNLEEVPACVVVGVLVNVESVDGTLARGAWAILRPQVDLPDLTHPQEFYGFLPKCADGSKFKTYCYHMWRDKHPLTSLTRLRYFGIPLVTKVLTCFYPKHPKTKWSSHYNKLFLMVNSQCFPPGVVLGLRTSCAWPFWKLRTNPPVAGDLVIQQPCYKWDEVGHKLLKIDAKVVQLRSRRKKRWISRNLSNVFPTC